jgi:hypothetical protein
MSKQHKDHGRPRKKKRLKHFCKAGRSYRAVSVPFRQYLILLDFLLCI